MKFNMVNDDKLQIIISKEDMEKHDMQKWDLTPHNPDAQKLFYEIMEQAREACGFDVGNNAQLMIEDIDAGMAAGKLTVKDASTGKTFHALCSFTQRQQAILKAGGLLNYTKEGGL